MRDYRSSHGRDKSAFTNSMCLQCHGKQEGMDYDLEESILKLYPQDKATGYSENEVRGIWKIAFKK